MFIIIPWVVKLSAKFELLFVNGFGLPFNSGTIFYFILLIALPGFVFIRKIFPISKRSKVYSDGDSDHTAESYWKPKLIGLLDIAISITIAFILATIAFKISDFFSQSSFHIIVQSLLGQKYLVLTTL